MMVPLLHAIKASRQDHGLSMEKFYSHVGISRQGFFKMAHHEQKERQMLQEIDTLVGKYRKHVDRRAGSRSLYYNLDIKLRLDIGVSKFERILSEGGLSLAPVRTRVVTTRSSLQSWNYSNLINGLTLNDINQVVAGDLTYVYIYGRRYLLFCLTDLYSARIVGHHIGLYMRAEDAKKALDMWVSLRKEENLKGCIHHTDGGSQYFSDLYLRELRRLEVQISRAENCLMNGHAEQRNGLIKHHLLPTIRTSNPDGLAREIKRILDIYNHQRKQEALGWLSPCEFEEKTFQAADRPKRILHNFNDWEYGFSKA